MLWNDATKSGWRVIGLSVLCGAFAWVLDAVLDFLLFSSGDSTFLDVLILNSPAHEVYMRSVILVVFIGFGVLVSRGVARQYQAARSLRESENKYQDLYDNAPDMYVSVDPATAKIIRCNQTLAQATGYSKQEIVGMSVFDLYHPDCMEEVRAAFDSFVTTGTIHEAILQLKRKDGSKIDVSLNVVAVRDEEGNILYGRSSWRDITKSKKAAQVLAESEERFREIMANTHDGVAVYRAVNNGADFVFVDFNKAAERIEKIGRDDVIGRSILEVFPYVKLFGLFEVFQRVWRTGRPEHHPMKQYWDERITGWRETYVYKLSDGEVVVVYSDETDRKLAEDALRKRTRELDDRVKELTCMVSISRIAGRQDTPLADQLQAIADLIPPAWQYPEITCGRILYEGHSYSTRGFRRTPWGQSGVIKVSGREVGRVEVYYLQKMPELHDGPFQKEETMLLWAMALDIGSIIERRLLGETILTHRRDLQQLASQMSMLEEQQRRAISAELHDRIGQNLVAAKINAGLLQGCALGEDESKWTDRILRLIDETVKDVRSLTYELCPPLLYELGLVPAVEWLLLELEKTRGLSCEIRHDGHAYDTQREAQPVPLEDEIKGLLFQAVREILTNVVKHAQAQSVGVSVRTDERNVTIKVEDDGVGFDPSKIGHGIGEKGGFGLFSIRERLRYAGGQLEIESGPDEGSRITLIAPLAVASRLEVP